MIILFYEPVSTFTYIVFIHPGAVSFRIASRRSTFFQLFLKIIMNDFWQQVYFGNTIQNWAVAIGIVVIGFILLKIIKKIVLIRLQSWADKTSTSIDDIIIRGLERSVIPLLYVLLIYTAIKTLTIPEKTMHYISSAFSVAVMFFILRAITSAVNYFILVALKKKKDSEMRQKQARGLIVILTITIWVLGFIFLLDNLGYNVATLIAGLGIGGIAIALAAQTILGDLFSYFVIYFDRPFEIGDFVSIGDKSGTVEYIGLKTTRIRTPAGDQLVCSNTDLTNSRLHNFGRMEKRRVVFKIGVVYQISTAQLKEIPEIVTEIIKQQENVEFDRAHFTGFGSSSLDFEFVYYLLIPDFSLYMDTHQKILLKMFEEFVNKKIGFAYPTQTLFLEPAIKQDEVVTE
jgi:small-conductance mechanosensitive channel